MPLYPSFPTFFDTERPSNTGPGSFSTMNAEMPSSVRAARATIPARSPFVTHALVPLTIHSSPSRTARHEMLRVSVPASGSESDSAPRARAVDHLREPPLLLRVGAVGADQRRAHRVRVDHARQRHPSVGELLDHPDVGEQVEAEAAVLLGDRDPEEPELLHRLDDRGRVLVGVLELAGDGDHLARDPLAHGGDHLLPQLRIGGRWWARW